MHPPFPVPLSEYLCRGGACSPTVLRVACRRPCYLVAKRRSAWLSGWYSGSSHTAWLPHGFLGSSLIQQDPYSSHWPELCESGFAPSTEVPRVRFACGTRLSTPLRKTPGAFLAPSRGWPWPTGSLYGQMLTTPPPRALWPNARTLIGRTMHLMLPWPAEFNSGQGNLECDALALLGAANLTREGVGGFGGRRRGIW